MRKIIVIIFFILTNYKGFAQNIINAGNDTSICGGSVTLMATLNPAGFQVASFQNVPFNSPCDDCFSQTINIGFTFNYYGNNYTQCVVSSNNYISFNTAQAGGYSPYSISGNVPNTGNAPLNSILGPWQDINPGVGGTIRYATVGTAPNRVFVVEYCNVPMFSCTNLQFSSQILLYEGSNNIETHIISKPVCTTWNSGQAIHATHNNNGTLAHVVPGRNAGAQWTTANEGRRWVPTSATNYNIINIPFNPIILGNPGNIEWRVAGTPTVIGTGPSITVSPSTTTNYVASITGGCSGIVFRDTVQVIVGAAQLNASADVSICLGSSTQLNVLNFNPTLTYSWSPATGLNNPNIHNPVASPTVTTAYVVTATSTINPNCVSHDTVIVTVDNPPTVTATDTAICIGSTVTISANPSIPNGTFVWQPSGSFGQSINVNPTVSTNYIVSYTVNTCPTVYDTATVTVYSLPTIVITPQQNPICAGTSTVLTANGGVTYLWQYSPNISDTVGSSVIVNPPLDERFYVRGRDAFGCSDTTSVEITVYPELSIIGSSDTAICFGDTTKPLFVSASGGNGGPYTYTWLPSNSLTYISNTLVKAHPPVTTSYFIVATDNCTVIPAVDTITVTINPLPLVNIDTDTTQGCMPLKINFKNLTTPAPASCFWNFGDGNYSTACGNQVNTYKEEGIFSVSLLVTDVNGCKNKLENYPITVFPLPKADFLYMPQPVNVLDQYTQFIDTSSADVITWWWDFAGLGYDSIQHPYFKFKEAGEFPVKQVVMNSYGCYDSIIRIITVNDNLSLWIPNSFTPGNKDGLNDAFMPIGLSVYNGNFELRIFNRWGEEIFKTNTVENPWTAENCQAGVYTWRLDIKEPQGKLIVKYGHINLIR